MPGKVAILPWGDVIEDFLDTIGTDLTTFATGMSGGWLFGYVAALRRVGLESCLICVTRERAPRRIVHPGTGLVTIALPVHPAFTALRRKRGLTGRLAGQVLDRLATPRDALARTLREEGVSAVLCQEYEYHRTAAALAAGRTAGVPVHATFQGGFPSPLPFERWRRARAIRGLDGLVIASQAEAERVTARYGVAPERIARIVNPLDTEAWHPVERGAARAALGLPAAARIAVCHTRIDIHRKGLDIMLEAWRRLMAGSDKDWRLHLIGTGSDAGALRELIARDPVPGLRWIGYTADRDAMRTELGAADVYVSASRNEGQAVAPLEAMACGLPVILSAAPGSAETLPEREASGGRIVPVGDAGALQAALSDFLGDAAFSTRTGQAARARVARFASLDVVGQELAQAFRA